MAKRQPNIYLTKGETRSSHIDALSNKLEINHTAVRAVVLKYTQKTII
jgi:hypothetical protein